MPSVAVPADTQLQSAEQQQAVSVAGPGVAAPDSTSQKQIMGNQGDSNSEATSVVTDFYRALEVSDGTKAASYIIPEKTIAGPLSSEMMTRFYSSLRKPLQLRDVTLDTDGSVVARYSYTYQSGKECRGTARLLLTKRGNSLLINQILANEQCG